MLKTKRPLVLGCFSPPVMIATFAIEIGLAAYVVWRYQMTTVTRIATALLLCLAIFQLAEYNVCAAAFGLSSSTWSRIGFVAITALPPLGIHLSTAMAKRRRPALVAGAYAVGVVFAAIFLLTPSINGHQCMGNYVIFQVMQNVMPIYGLYYWGLLVAGVALCWQYARAERSVTRRRAQHLLATGYLLFMVPTLIVMMLDPVSLSAIPSVMCGFAVLLAVTLAGGVLPNYYKHTSLVRQLRERLARQS